MKKNIAALFLLFVVVGCTGMSLANFPFTAPGADPALPEKGMPVRILLEAEDFTVRQGAWMIVPYRENYFASTFAITFISRQALLGAPEQMRETAVAEQRIVIPYADKFQVMARYEQPYNFSCEFTLEIEQNGRTVYRRDYGRLDDPKVWPLNRRQRVPMERFFWGGTDNIVWQHFEPVALEAGPALVRLLAAPQVNAAGSLRENAARRHVDVIAITNDKDGIERQAKTRYLEFDGWLQQHGDVFARITNLGGDSRVFTLAPHRHGEHSPYYVHVRESVPVYVTRDGMSSPPPLFAVIGPRAHQVNPDLLAPLDAGSDIPPRKLPHAERGLPPGTRSGWIAIGQMLDSMHNSKWVFNPETKVRLELGRPDGRGGVQVLWDNEVGAATVFEMPQAVNPNPELAELLAKGSFAPVLRTDIEALRWLRDRIREFPKTGSTPERLLIYHLMGFSNVLGSKNEELRALAREIALLLGDNTAVNQEGRQRRLHAHWPTYKLDEIRKYKEDGKLNDLRIVSYGDEIHLPPIPPTAEEFAEFLRQRNAPGREQAEYTAARDNPWFYYSRLAAYEKGGQSYAAATAYYGEHGILTGANYSPHSNYLVNEVQYMRTFKLKAMSMPWSEDYIWQIPEFSIQAMGWLTSGLRAGAKYHDLPVHMYVMPHSPGNTPHNFRLSFYQAIAHGAKMINYFCATPLAVASTENYIATQDLDMWRAVHDVSHQAGRFEDYIMDGRPRQARVGLLLSSVDDILTGITNSSFAMHNNERKAVYYAARHAQVPIDFLSEDDVIDGLAADYDVIYVAQEYLHSRAIAALQAWAEAGGTVISLAGGGFKDEFRRENPAAAALFGITAQERLQDPELEKILIRPNSPFLTKQDLPLYQPMDTVTWKHGELAGTAAEVIVWKQTMTPDPQSQVLAAFADGSPAAVLKNHGRGRAVLIGFLPGQAYLKSGLPVRPVDRGSADSAFTHYNPTGMDQQLRRLLVDQWLPQNFTRPVETDAYLVEATVIDTAAPNPRLAVPLMNLSGKPVPSLTVTIPGITAVKAVRSLEQPQLNYTASPAGLTVTLPLELTDMLLIDLP